MKHSINEPDQDTRGTPATDSFESIVGKSESQLIAEQQPPDKITFIGGISLAILVLLLAIVFFLKIISGNKGEMFGEANIVLEIPTTLAIIVLSFLLYRWATGKVKIKLVLFSAAAVILIYGAPFAFLYSAQIQQLATTDAYFSKLAKKVDYKIYLPNDKLYSSDPYLRDLSEDGPVMIPDYRNPKTGTKNFGVSFQDVGNTGTAMGSVTIYNKKYVPDEFMQCGPLTVRDYFDGALRAIKTNGCEKMYTTDSGYNIYGYKWVDDYVYAMDIGDSRVVFEAPRSLDSARVETTTVTTEVSKTSTSKLIVPDEFKNFVNSFHEVDLYSLEYGASNRLVKLKR